MVNLIQSPSTSHAYSKLLTHGDGERAHGWWRWRRWRWRWRRPPDPSTGGEILDQSVPETKIVVVAAVCFAKAPLSLGQVFFLIYEGIRRRPEARRCPRPILWGAHMATVPGRMGPPLLALRHPLLSIFLYNVLLFQKKWRGIFSLILFPAKIARGETLLKTASESAVLFKYGRIPEQIMRQSAWKSGCILDASSPPSLARCLSSNNSNIVQKR